MYVSCFAFHLILDLSANLITSGVYGFGYVQSFGFCNERKTTSRTEKDTLNACYEDLLGYIATHFR